MEFDPNRPIYLQICDSICEQILSGGLAPESRILSVREYGASIGVNGAKLNSQDARPAKGEKLKDDGTCWAITEKGTRCKNHKDGEKDYCKLHAADKRVKITPARCRALTYEGTRCSRAPEPGYNYCKQHGAPANLPPPTPIIRPLSLAQLM